MIAGTETKQKRWFLLPAKTYSWWMLLCNNNLWLYEFVTVSSIFLTVFLLIASRKSFQKQMRLIPGVGKGHESILSKSRFSIHVYSDWKWFLIFFMCHGNVTESTFQKKSRAKANKQSLNGAHDEMILFVWFHLFGMTLSGYSIDVWNVSRMCGTFQSIRVKNTIQINSRDKFCFHRHKYFRY
jgi:hypothetical protein